MTNWITRLNPREIQQEDDVYVNSENVIKSAKQLGFEEINYAGYSGMENNPQKRRHLIHAILRVVQPGDLVVVQFPMWTHLNFQSEFIDYLCTLKSVKIVGLLHAIPTWMSPQGRNDIDLGNDFWLKQLKKFDFLMTPNDKAGHQLKKDGIDGPMISMTLQDYFYSGVRQEKTFKKKLYYVSDYGIETSNYTASTPLYLYSSYVAPSVLERGSIYRLEYKLKDEIISSLDGGFGVLVTMNFKEITGINLSYYNQFSTPTQLSLYLAAGLPVITQNNTPHAQMVREQGLGLVVEDLNTIDQVLSTITSQDYKEMLEQVKPFQNAVSEGFFIKRALMTMLRTLELGFKDDSVYKK